MKSSVKYLSLFLLYGIFGTIFAQSPSPQTNDLQNNAQKNGIFIHFERKSEDIIQIKFQAKSFFRNAQALVFQNGEEIFSQTLSLTPDKPFQQAITIPTEAENKEFQVFLMDAEGKCLAVFPPLISQQK